MKRMNKKGFTLAELLIVVGIIAVLTAIAVPLFVGALNNAEDSVKQANIRAVRVQAVSRILLAKEPAKAPTAAGQYSEDGIFVSEGTGTFTWKRNSTGPFYVTAKVSESGAISDLKISTDVGSWTADVCEAADSGYTVTLKLTIDDLNAASGYNGGE